MEQFKEVFYLTMHSTHFITYMASDMVKDHSAREETLCHHYMGYHFWLATRVLLYAPSHRPDSTYHSLCYTSRGTLAGMRNSSIIRPWRINPMTHHTMSGCFSSALTKRKKEVFYLTMHSTHYIYGYMASGISKRTTQIAREETRCRHTGYSFRLAARVLLNAPSQT